MINNLDLESLEEKMELSKKAAEKALLMFQKAVLAAGFDGNSDHTEVDRCVLEADSAYEVYEESMKSYVKALES